jgi:hypothetical protein
MTTGQNFSIKRYETTFFGGALIGFAQLAKINA